MRVPRVSSAWHEVQVDAPRHAEGEADRGGDVPPGQRVGRMLGPEHEGEAGQEGGDQQLDLHKGQHLAQGEGGEEGGRSAA